MMMDVLPYNNECRISPAIIISTNNNYVHRCKLQTCSPYFKLF